MTASQRRALVVIPTYNERDTIVEVATRLFEWGEQRVELLVVDDASQDGTADAVAGLAAGGRPVHLIRRPAKLGLGTAYVAGFEWALQRDYWAVVEMDGDSSHDPIEVDALLGALDGADVVIGSRYVEGGGVANWGRLRRALSRLGNLYADAALGLEVKDSTSGFRAYRRAFLAAAGPDTLSSEGYAFQIELTRRARALGATIVEVPITFVEREAGASKLSRAIVLEAAYRVTRWGLQDRVGARARKGTGVGHQLP